MGEVYRARDTRLGRTVALKILPEGLAADPDRRRRFEHEAHAASALNHPHICALFDVGEAVPSTPASRVPLAAPQPEAPRPGEGGNPVSVSYLVMEHLDGETLAARIARGPLPIPDVLAYGAQIADALSAAHRGGIIHRDLKPANVMLTGSGVPRNIAGAVKLLDFGLAKLKGAAGAGVTADAFGAAPALMTTPGQIVGTLPYMAPEQVEGRDADGRTDIWALGAMLYEMVTGARAFQAPTSASLTAAILEHEPAPISSTQPLTPPSLDRLIRKCLAKDPDERWQSARDVAGELRWMLAPAGNDAATSMAPRRGRRLWPGLAAAGIIVATMIGAGATWLLRPGRARACGCSPQPRRPPGRAPERREQDAHGVVADAGRRSDGILVDARRTGTRVHRPAGRRAATLLATARRRRGHAPPQHRGRPTAGHLVRRSMGGVLGGRRDQKGAAGRRPCHRDRAHEYPDGSGVG